MPNKDQVISDFQKLLREAQASLRRHDETLEVIQTNCDIASLTVAILEGARKLLLDAREAAHKDLQTMPATFVANDSQVSDYLFADGTTTVLVANVTLLKTADNWGVNGLLPSKRQSVIVDSAIDEAIGRGAAILTEYGTFSSMVNVSGREVYIRVLLEKRDSSNPPAHNG